MMKDISSREDVELLVDTFYEKVLKDEVIGFIFTEISPISLETHMPIMYDFWCSILLNSNSYKGNPMIKHFAINEKLALEKVHFERWLLLWKTTLDAHFEGPVAKEAYNRANQIAHLMEYKMAEATHGK
jgi:hemoglobin